MPFLLRLACLSTLLFSLLWFAVATKWPVDADIIFYATALKEFSAQFWHGDLWPRWLMEADGGLGSPVFLFYPPVTFWLSSLLQLLSPLDPYGLGRTLLSMQLATIACGFTCYCWLKTILPKTQAETGGLIYAGFPGLALIIYYDFGISQLWALAWFPLLLLAARRLAATGWRGIPALSLAYALLALTHLPSTIVFAPVPVFYAAAFAPEGKRLQTFLQAGLAGALGAAISAAYLIPAKLNEPFILTSYFLTGNGDFSLNFIKLRNLVAALLVLLPLIGFFVELPKMERRQFLPREVKFWLCAILYFLFMTSYLSYPLWKILPPMRYLQFPWRMLVGAIPAAVYISALWLPHVKSRSFYWWFSGLAFAINGYVGTASLFFPSDRPLSDTLKYGLIIEKEYQTPWMATAGLDLHLHFPESLRNMPPVKLMQGKGKIEVLASGPRTIALHADLESNAKVELRRLYFPGWAADSDKVKIEESSALLGLSLLKGHYALTLRQHFAGESEGAAVTLAALGALLALWAASRLRPRAKAL